MALIFADRVKETTDVVGTGVATLLGSSSGFDTFAAGIGLANTCYYAIVNNTNGQWEVGLGTVGSGAFSRDTVYASSNSDTYVDFSAGTKDIFNTIPANFLMGLGTGGSGTGDMLKSVYDTDNSGVVDEAEKMTTWGRNATGSTLYRGTIVYISGSTGNRPNFSKAVASGESTSAGTFGVVVNDIPNNSDGKVATLGTLDNLDTRTTATNPFTDVTLVDGNTLYLHPSIPGYVTNVKPQAPNHIVYVGKVIRTTPTLGTIVYRIQNGYELDEIHDVQVGPTYTDKGVLYRDNSTNLWKHATIESVLGFSIQPLLNSSSSINIQSGVFSDITVSAVATLKQINFNSSSSFPSNILTFNWIPSVNTLSVASGSNGKIQLNLLVITGEDFTFNGATLQSGFVKSLDSFGIGLLTPTAYVDIKSSTISRASLRLRSGSTPTSPNDGEVWYNGTDLMFRIGANSYSLNNQGTVTSISMSVPTGLSITGSPITTSGTFALSYASGYSIPTTIKQSNWDDAYTWVAGFPTQTGNAGKVLTTNGSVLSWGDFQPLDGDLTSIAALSGTSGLLRKTAANTWALDTSAYLTSYTETDPIFTASGAFGITTTDRANWSTAYGWGNHASAGYSTLSGTNTFTAVNTFSNVTDSSSSTTGGVIISGGLGVAKKLYVGTDANIGGNLTIGGNFTVNGTLTTINTTNLAVEDNMIYLNEGSIVSNPDLGFTGNYNDGTYRHAGLFRDATDGVWRFFHQYVPEPGAEINIAHATFVYATVQAATFIGSLTGNADTVTNGVYTTGSYSNPSWITGLAWSKITSAPAFITLASLSATTPIIYNNTTGAFSMILASTSTSGYLSSTDWNTFNNKQNALTGTSSQLAAGNGSPITIGSGLTLSAGTLTASGGGGGSTTVTFNRQTANYTLALSDASNVVEMNSSTNTVVTIPANSSVAFPVGSQIVLTQYGLGTPVVSPAAGVLINSANSSLAINSRYSSVTLIKVATDEWYFIGGISKGNSVQTSSLTGDVANANATANTYMDVTGLSFPVVSGKTYYFRFWIRYTAAATTTGSRWSINGPTTSFLLYDCRWTLTTTTYQQLLYQTAYNTGTVTTSSASTTNNIAIIEGTITASASGTVIARFASEVASSAITAKIGSFVNYQLMN